MPDERYLRFASLAQDATRKMILLCDSLLAEDEVTAPVQPRKCDVGQTIRAVMEFFGPMAEGQGVSLNVDIAEGLPSINAEPDTLSSALNNLMYSIQFTPKGGRVSVLAREDESEKVAVLIICDTGVGIDPEQLATVMQAEDMRVSSTVGVHGDKGSGSSVCLLVRHCSDDGRAIGNPFETGTWDDGNRQASNLRRRRAASRTLTSKETMWLRISAESVR